MKVEATKLKLPTEDEIFHTIMEAIKQPGGYIKANTSIKDLLKGKDVIYMDYAGCYRLKSSNVKVLFQEEIPLDKIFYISEEAENKMASLVRADISRVFGKNGLRA